MIPVYNPSAENPRNEVWEEHVEHDDGSVSVRRHGIVDAAVEVEHSDLYHQAAAKVREMGIEPPAFLEELRKAEAAINPIQDEAMQFLAEMGPPSYLEGTEWDTEDDWKQGRW